MSLLRESKDKLLPADGVIILVMIAAAVLALAPHLHRSAFYDEAWVIDSAIAPSATEGLAILLHDKSPASAGYVATAHYLTRIVTPTTWLFRAAEALFGIITVLLAMWLAYSWSRTGPPMILAAAVLLAMPMYQRYATEVKQYIVEAALTLGMILAVRSWVTGKEAIRRRAAWCWFALALIAIVSTFAGWFSIAGTGIVAGCFLLKKRDGNQVKRAIAFAIAIACVAAVVHLRFNRYISGSSTLEGYWADYYLPANLNWPVKTWDAITTFFRQCWFRYDRFPALAMSCGVLIGFPLWIRRQPVTGSAALAVVLVTLAASTAKLWPLNLRVNLHMLVILHLAAIIGPVFFASWLWDRYKPALRPSWLPWLGVPAALVVGILLWRESRSGDYEIAAVDKLLDQTAKVSTDNDIVILLPAARVTQQLHPRPIAGTIRHAPWASAQTILRDVIPLLALGSQRPVVFAVSHHHGGVPEAFRELGQALLPFGRFSLTWNDRFVAIYRFDPRPGEPAKPSHTPPP